jgi:hypothetical protein
LMRRWVVEMVVEMVVEVVMELSCVGASARCADLQRR